MLPAAADLFRDLRFALRAWARQPGIALSTVLMLALGIGAVTTVYAIAYAELWRPSPVRDPATLEGVIAKTSMGGASGYATGLLPEQYLALQHAPGLAGIAAMMYRQQTLRLGGSAVTVLDAQVSPNILQVLGLSPALGRGFLPSEAQPGHGAVAVIGYETWRVRFGATRDILGRTVQLDNRTYTVVGVLPRALSSVYPQRIGFWTPLRVGPSGGSNLFSGRLDVSARLRHGVTPAQFNQYLAVVSSRLNLRFHGRPVTLAAFNWAQAKRGAPGRPLLLALLAAVAMLLLIACANVAGLLLARGVGRRHEFAVRHALGATRGRIVRQLLAEAALLAAAAAGVGVALAHTALPILRASPLQQSIEWLASARLDPQVLGIALLATVATVFLTALLPAFSVARVAHGGPATGADGEGRPWLRGAFLAAELALSVVLLVSAGLIGKSLFRLSTRPSGLDEAHLAAVEFQLTPAQGTQPRAGSLAVQLLDDVRGRLAWRSVALCDFAPTDYGFERIYSIGAGRPARTSPDRVVGAGYFSTVGQKILLGRDFDQNDSAGAPGVLIVNQAWVREYSPHASPLGLELYYSNHPPGTPPTAFTPHRIVGVVSDARDFDVTEPGIPPELYEPITQGSLYSLALVYNAARPGALLPSLRRILGQAAPDLPVTTAQTVAGYSGDDLAQQRFQAYSFALFAGLGLLFALAGIWALVAFSVEQRQREFGIRMALGANAARILGPALRETLQLCALGAALGLAGAWAASHLLAHMLFQLSPTDPATYAAVVILFIAVAAAAAYFPARRALEADPAATLRCE